MFNVDTFVGQLTVVSENSYDFFLGCLYNI